MTHPPDPVRHVRPVRLSVSVGYIPHTHHSPPSTNVAQRSMAGHPCHIKRTEIMETRSTGEIQESTEKLLQDLRAVVHDGEELLKAGANELNERGLAARERLAAALEVAKETRRKLEERALAGARATDQLIREHPYESIVIAFGVGL